MIVVGEGKWWSFRIAVVVLLLLVGGLTWVVIDQRLERRAYWQAIQFLRADVERMRAAEAEDRHEPNEYGVVVLDGFAPVPLDRIDGRSVPVRLEKDRLPPGDYHLDWPPQKTEEKPEVPKRQIPSGAGL